MRLLAGLLVALLFSTVFMSFSEAPDRLEGAAPPKGLAEHEQHEKED